MGSEPLSGYAEAHVRGAKRWRVRFGFAAAAIFLWLAEPTVASLVAGAAMAAVGLLLRGLAAGHLTKDSVLTTTGPYAVTRNPLYLGSGIVAAGLAVASRSPWVVAMLAALFVVVYLPVIRSEERFLAARFPEHAEHARRVPRFIPRLGDLGKAAGGGFAWTRYRRHREYRALIGTTAMVGALVVKLLLQGRG